MFGSGRLSKKSPLLLSGGEGEGEGVKRVFQQPARRRQSGVTLIELIVVIVIVSVGVIGILQVMSFTTQHSADPMIRQQAQLIAESYLEEILLKKFVDQQNDSVCPPPEPAGRTEYDNVCDYRGINDTGAKNQFGTPVAGLEAYSVAVTVTRDNTVNLNGLTNGPAADEIRVLRVDVTVTAPGGVIVLLAGYRTNYRCQATIPDTIPTTDNQCRPLT